MSAAPGFRVLPDPVDLTDPAVPVDAAAIRNRVLDYLTRGTAVAGAFSLGPDLLDPRRPAAVPRTTVTDGAWIWPGSVAYYLREHDRWPPAAFLADLRAAHFRMPPRSPDVAARAVDFLRSRSGAPDPGPQASGGFGGSGGSGARGGTT